MPSPKEKEEKIKFREEVKDHAIVILESGASRETAIAETRVKYDLSLRELEAIVPHIEVEKVAKKDEGKLIGKADGRKFFATK